MNTHDLQRRADDLLEAALKEFGRAEPRLGLEGRILVQVRAEQRTAGRAGWNWGYAAAAAVAVMAIAAVLLGTLRTSPPVRTADRVVQTPPPAASTPVERQTASVRVSGARRKRPASAAPAANLEPRLDRFPSPQPLSEQERILASYVEARRQEARALAHAQAELRQQDQEEFEMLAEQQRNSSGTPQ